MDDERIMHGMRIDDAYHVVRVLANRRGRVTELVTLADAGPFVRKKMPSVQTNRVAWAALPACASKRLPQISTTYELPGTFVVVHSFVPGETVEARVRERRRLDAREAVSTTIDICEAAAALHTHGIIHCDISPANIVLAADGAHLIDLGAARMMTDPAPKRGERLGTLGFSAPERMLATPSAKSDVYSIGRVLGYMLTGIDPADDDFDRTFAEDADVPQTLRGVVIRASAFEASARYGSAEEMAEELRAWLANDDAETSHEKPDDRVSAPQDTASASGTASHVARDRRVIKFVLLALAVVMALCAAGIIVYQVAVQTNGHGAASSTQSQKIEPGFWFTPYAAFSTDAGVDEASAVSTGEATRALAIDESWWEVDEGGFLNYYFALRNDSHDVYVRSPEIVVVVQDESGAIIASDILTMRAVPPRGIVCYASGLQVDGVPASVSFEPAAPYNGSERVEINDAGKLEASNVKTVADGAYVTVTGDVTAERLGTDAQNAQSAAIALVFKKDDGEIVNASVGYSDLPEQGEALPFEVRTICDADFSDVEVHVFPW